MAGLHSVTRVLFSLITGHLAAGSLFLDVHPANISQDLTDYLNVNCSFSQQNTTNVSSVATLLISFAPSTNNPENLFQDLYSINAFIPGSFAKLSPKTATVSGQINPSEASYLNLQWETPSEKHSGLYRCDAYGFDSVGRPVNLSTEARVDTHIPDENELLAIIDELKKEVEDLKKNQSDIMEMCDTKSQEQAQCESNLAQCQTVLKDSNKHLCPFPDDFAISKVYNGSHYILSLADWSYASSAEATCELYGGYLVEIDSLSEHLFIKSFLNSASSANYVLVGATDQFEEGTWEFRYSRRPVRYDSWQNLEPDNQPDYDCAELRRDMSWNMADYFCTTPWPGRKFLCEIPI